ncbi:hypothetical protein [Rhizohabitans arisaemae]|nr:hypothetical protein [Rhizohabitans arisaemae]
MAVDPVQPGLWDHVITIGALVLLLAVSVGIVVGILALVVRLGRKL